MKYKPSSFRLSPDIVLSTVVPTAKIPLMRRACSVSAVQQWIAHVAWSQLHVDYIDYR